MRAAPVILALAIGCRSAPAPAQPQVAETVDAGRDGSATAAPPKDPLPVAVERVVQLFEVIAALPPASSCAQSRAAAVAARAEFRGDVAVVLQARAERPAELEPLWTASQPRLGAAWLALQRWPCEGADAIDLLEEDP